MSQSTPVTPITPVTPMRDFDPRHRNHEAPVPKLQLLVDWAKRALAVQPFYVLGVDLSHWNEIVDFQALKAAGYVFVILKATEHTSFVDSKFSVRWPQALDAGFIVGTYHFLRMNYGGANQAEHHLRIIDPLLKATDGKIIPPASDIETLDGMSTAARQETIRRFDDKIQGELAVDALAYSSPALWRQIAENMTLDCIGWCAHWTSALAPIWPSGWPVSKRLFWQFGVYPKHSWVAPVPGVSGEVDVNRFFGTLNDLRTFVGIHDLTDHEKVELLWKAHPGLEA